MGQFLWTLDAPTGVFKSNSMSSKLRFAAVADAKFMQFVRTEPGFGKKKGETHTITRVSNVAVPTSGVLSAGVRIPVDPFSLSTVGITVSEYGRAIEFSSLAEDLSKFDLEQPVQRKLKDQMKLVLDAAIAAAFKTAKICAIPTSLSAITWDTDGTPSTQATQNITVAHLGVIRDYMTDTLHVPFWEGEEYVGLSSTKSLRGIKNDPDFLAWRQYIQPGDVLLKSEVGKVEQIRLVEVNNTAALSNAKGYGSVLGEMIIFGEDAVGMIEVVTPELRAAIPGDYGRSKGIAWYGVLGFGIIWDTANDGEARIVRVTSS